MKNTILAGALVVAAAAPAFAGGKAGVVMEPAVIIETTVQDSAQGPIVMTVAILTVLGAALSH